MLRINSISNVNNTLNKISFGNGLQTNFGLASDNKQNMVEGGFFTGFVGTLERGLRNQQIQADAYRIKAGLDNVKKQQEQKLNIIA